MVLDGRVDEEHIDEGGNAQPTAGSLRNLVHHNINFKKDALKEQHQLSDLIIRNLCYGALAHEIGMVEPSGQSLSYYNDM